MNPCINRPIYIVGESHDTDITFAAFNKVPNVRTLTYDQLFSGKSVLESDSAVLLGFPYSLWDMMVEHNDELYGSSASFGKSIQSLFDIIQERIDFCLPNAQYVNHPQNIVIERDKLESKRILSEYGITVAENLPKSMETIFDELEQGRRVYIKPRFGSLGKGITYLERFRWTTNFAYEHGQIHNHLSDEGWNEIEITGDKNFLKQILEYDVVVEKAITNPQTSNGLKFDMRSYVIFDKAKSRFAHGRLTTSSSITNISQGAEEIFIEDFERYLSPRRINDSLTLARTCTKVLGLNYSGVDLLFRGENYEPIFLEINSFPGPFPAVFDEMISTLYKDMVRGLHVEQSGLSRELNSSEKFSKNIQSPYSAGKASR